jgi:hypothetical protein
MPDSLVRHSEHDRKRFIFFYGTPISGLSRGFRCEQVLPARTVSLVREIRQKSLSMLHQFFLSDGMGSFIFSLTFSSEDFTPPIFS